MKSLLEFIARYAPWIYGLCALGILFYARIAFLAQRERRHALFSLEKEVATSRALRSLAMIGVLLLAVGMTFFIGRVPSVARPPAQGGIPPLTPLVTPLLIPTPIGPSPTPILTPSPSPTRAPVTPTATPQPLPTYTPAPTPPPQACPNADPKARLTSPWPGARLKGQVPIMGTANVPKFQFYKVEFASAQSPDKWNNISPELHKQPIEAGTLEVWNTDLLPEGAYILRLTVVDLTGNYPTPCEVPVVIERKGS